VKKQRFLVANDYGTGAVWASVLAHSAEEIAEKYPSLKIVAQPPPWLNSPELLKDLEERMTVDIDDQDHAFLVAARS
jgi:hypothetical protein